MLSQNESVGGRGCLIVIKYFPVPIGRYSQNFSALETAFAGRGGIRRIFTIWE